MCKLKADFAPKFALSEFVLEFICFDNLSDSQFIENDSIGSNLSYSINWESDRLEKEWIRAQIHHNTNFGAKKRAKSRFWTLILEYIPCMNHTQNVFITWQKKHEFWRELLPKSRNSFNITDSQKRPYRDAKIKKLECGRNWTLYRVCTMVGTPIWKDVSGAQVKTTQSCFVLGASVRWAFELINASGPGIPTT